MLTPSAAWDHVAGIELRWRDVRVRAFTTSVRTTSANVRASGAVPLAHLGVNVLGEHVDRLLVVAHLLLELVERDGDLVGAEGGLDLFVLLLEGGVRLLESPRALRHTTACVRADGVRETVVRGVADEGPCMGLEA